MTAVRPFMETSEEYEGGLFYPSEDGPNELDTDAPLVARRLIREALEDYFATDPDVYVGAGIPCYVVASNRKPFCRPDAFVAFGSSWTERTSWHIHREGIAPTVVFHVLTRGNRENVLGRVKDRCERSNVKEFHVFDPEVVFGFRLRNGRYSAIRPEGDGGVRSRLLGLRLVSEYGYPRFVDGTTGEVVLTRREQALRSVRRKQAGRGSHGG